MGHSKGWQSILEGWIIKSISLGKKSLEKQAKKLRCKVLGSKNSLQVSEQEVTRFKRQWKRLSVAASPGSHRPDMKWNGDWSDQQLWGRKKCSVRKKSPGEKDEHKELNVEAQGLEVNDKLQWWASGSMGHVEFRGQLLSPRGSIHKPWKLYSQGSMFALPSEQQISHCGHNLIRRPRNPYMLC